MATTPKETSTQPSVRVQGISKWYPHKTGKLIQGPKDKRPWVKAVDDISFDIAPGEILGVIGESGCGKSTLGRMLCRLEEPTSGDVFIEGVSTGSMIKKDFRAFRRTVQMIFQNPFDTFTPRDTIGEILMRPLRIHHIGANDAERRQLCIAALENGGLFQNPFDTFTPRDTIGEILMRPLRIHHIGANDAERRQLCIAALENGGLRPAEDIMARFPHELSGGQLQRVSIIRSMSLNPSLIVADEPVSMLDVSVRADIINMLIDVSKNRGNAMVFISHDIAVTRNISDNIAVMYLGRIVEYGTAQDVMLIDVSKNRGNAMVFISHDIAVTRNISDNIAVMYLGRIVEYGTAQDVVSNPQHPYTQALISNCTSIDPDDVSEPIPIKGEPPTPVDPGPGCYFAPRCFKACERCFKEYPSRTAVSDTHWATCWRMGEHDAEDVAE